MVLPVTPDSGCTDNLHKNNETKSSYNETSKFYSQPSVLSCCKKEKKAALMTRSILSY